jgi:FAD/FMN-containing dehydrogenase
VRATPAGPNRRQVLAAAGAAGLAAVLAACTRRSEDGPPSGSATASGPTATTAEPTTTGPKPTLASLSRSLSRPLLLPATAGYPGAARLYNPRFDSVAHPAAIAQCSGPADVQRCVTFAADTDLPLALRNGGHSYGGWSTGPGLVIDCSPMSAVTVDQTAGTARIGAGSTLAHVYGQLGAAGVAIAGGSCPTVGITGLTLGGGVGVLTRAFGLTCDAVQSVQIVTADGRLREVSAKSDPDLFWALRGGGGGSFGVVTAFTMAVRPAPTVQLFFLQWDFSRASDVLAAWQSWVGGTDRQLWSTCKLLADPGPSGGLKVTVSGTWIGAPSALAAQFAPLLAAAGPTTTNQQSSLSYQAAMYSEAGCYGQSEAACLADALSPAKRQPFSATSAILSAPLPSAGVAAAVAMVQAAMNVPGLVEGGVSFDSLGGAVADVAPTATAFPHRRALALIQYTATWPSGSGSGPVAPATPFDKFVRGERAALAPWTGPSAYVNYADSSLTDYPSAYWGANYPRLQSVKRQYDPQNLFTFAQSVKA